MLASKTQAESMKLKCSRELSTLEAIAAKWFSAILSCSRSLTMVWVSQSCRRVIFGTKKDTSIEAMQYLLDMPQMEIMQTAEQVKAYLNALQNPKNPLYNAIKEEKLCELARGMSWMGQADQSVWHWRCRNELSQENPVQTKFSSMPTASHMTFIIIIIMVVPRSRGWHYLCLLSVGTGVALQADPGLAEPCTVWALEVCICRWDTGCQVAAFSGGLCLMATLFL